MPKTVDAFMRRATGGMRVIDAIAPQRILMPPATSANRNQLCFVVLSRDARLQHFVAGVFSATQASLAYNSQTDRPKRQFGPTRQ